jgi:hypothetical protein
MNQGSFISSIELAVSRETSSALSLPGLSAAV